MNFIVEIKLYSNSRFVCIKPEIECISHYTRYEHQFEKP